uniref:Uncharacterized protein n=1 Tax=Arundo donax TaxID=35708 RepID=A0A0A9FMU6_ARUDO
MILQYIKIQAVVIIKRKNNVLMCFSMSCHMQKLYLKLAWLNYGECCGLYVNTFHSHLMTYWLTILLIISWMEPILVKRCSQKFMKLMDLRKLS